MRQICVAVIAAIIALTVGATVKVRAQGPGAPSARWSKAATFPQPDEELYGVAANGKMYVYGGFGGSHPVGMLWEYDPATDKWTNKQTVPVPVHHSALAEFRGKLYMFGGFIYNSDPSSPMGGWEPVDNAWEYNPAADTWRALAPLPEKRGAAVAVEVAGQIYVIGGTIPEPGSKEIAIRPNRAARSVGTNDAYDPESNKWSSPSPMPTARNHSFAGAVSGKIYVIGGRAPSSFITAASNLDIVEEYDPVSNTWGGPGARAAMPTARSGGGWAAYNGKIYVAGGEVQTRSLIGAFRALEA